MRAEGIIQESDYVRSQYLHIRPRPFLAIVGVLILALFAWVLVVSASWVAIGAAAYLALWLLVFIPWCAKRNYRRYKALSERVTIEVRDDGLFCRRENGEGLLPWPHVVKWRRSRNLLLLYVAGNIFILVPGHFFPSEQDYAAFAKIIEAKVGSAT